MIGLIDSHAHIIDGAYESTEEIVNSALNEGVEKIMIICCEFDQVDKAVDLKRSSNMFDVAVGIYPGDVKDVDENRIIELEEFLKSKEIDCLGEIGLDYYWQKDNKEEQISYFIKQINLANKYDLPIVVHSRDAAFDTLETLKNHPVNKKGIIHCYSQSVEMAKEYIKLGFYLGIGGVVTFKNAKVLKEVVKEIDLKYLLMETDCPYLTPTPFRGKLNEPKFVKYVYEYVAELKKISVEEVILSCQKNYNNLMNNG
jgi:TatD DNase family protein